MKMVEEENSLMKNMKRKKYKILGKKGSEKARFWNLIIVIRKMRKNQLIQ